MQRVCAGVAQFGSALALRGSLKAAGESSQSGSGAPARLTQNSSAVSLLASTPRMARAPHREVRAALGAEPKLDPMPAVIALCPVDDRGDAILKELERQAKAGPEVLEDGTHRYHPDPDLDAFESTLERIDPHWREHLTLNMHESPGP